ncbi:carbohydrate esterase family 1 [Trichoderma cornu-damae]|uniref:feruloyl esterase n=1 Tax=Trichoderma cornu-damae TaxID=654480 RepID=A0A9P8QGC2_9HYPO|nr:carbohydrate esterase family 1 [Trichoderma cornu-damae]
MFFSSYGIQALAVLAGILGPASGAAVSVERHASVGCLRTHNWAGQTKEFSLESSGGNRTYRVHLPNNYKRGSPRPLIIAYHGVGENSVNFETITQFSNSSVNPNMIVVYPAGVNGSWEGPTYAAPGVSDKVFTTDLVKRIKQNYCVDEARVYATGHSNGGGFVGTLACSAEHGGQFAAFAAVAGAFYTDVTGNDNCTLARSPLPMFETHGTADTTVPYNPTAPGRGGPLPSIPDWLSRWATRDQCTTSATTDLASGVHDTRWKCAGVDGVLRHVQIEGHDHSWPGQGSEFDISPQIIQFLSVNSKP